MKRLLITVAGLMLSSTLLLGAPTPPPEKRHDDKACKSCHGADGTPMPRLASILMKVEMKHLGSEEIPGSERC